MVGMTTNGTVDNIKLVLRQLNGCGYLYNPEGDGMEEVLKGLKILGLVSFEKMSSCGIKASGYRITSEGIVMLDALTDQERYCAIKQAKKDLHFHPHINKWTVYPHDIIARSLDDISDDMVIKLKGEAE